MSDTPVKDAFSHWNMARNETLVVIHQVYDCNGHLQQTLFCQLCVHQKWIFILNEAFSQTDRLSGYLAQVLPNDFRTMAFNDLTQALQVFLVKKELRLPRMLMFNFWIQNSELRTQNLSSFAGLRSSIVARLDYCGSVSEKFKRIICFSCKFQSLSLAVSSSPPWAAAKLSVNDKAEKERLFARTVRPASELCSDLVGSPLRHRLFRLPFLHLPLCVFAQTTNYNFELPSEFTELLVGLSVFKLTFNYCPVTIASRMPTGRPSNGETHGETVCSAVNQHLCKNNLKLA